MADQETTGPAGGEQTASTAAEPETTAVTVLSSSAPSAPDTQMEHSFRSYDHGFTNGLLRIEAQDFETFAEESEKLRFIRHQLYLVESEAQELRHTKATVTSERLSFTRARLEAEARQQTLTQQLQRAEEKRKENRTEQVAIDEEKSKLKPAYAWPPAILYLLAGFVFIAADIAVMHDVTRNGLNMDGEYEPWLFAIGLAFVAFLIKPAVDRILEKPYANNENVHLNHKALKVFAGAALITLGIMGYFRSEATSIDNQKTELGREVSKLRKQKQKLEVEEVNVAPINKQIAEVQEKIQQVDSARANSLSMRIGLVLASMLFAIASAVCLGIAFPAINNLHRSQFVLRNRRRKLVVNSTPLEEVVTSLETQLAEEQQRQKLLTFTFEELADLSLLESRMSVLQTRELELRQEFVNCQAARHRSLYRDGKARGATYELQGTLSYSVADADRRVAESHELEDRASVSGAPFEEDARRTGRRPYVVLRRLISQHYTRHRKNGQAESIEIE